jgi:hypothetical protein
MRQAWKPIGAYENLGSPSRVAELQVAHAARNAIDLSLRFWRFWPQNTETPPGLPRICHHREFQMGAFERVARRIYCADVEIDQGVRQPVGTGHASNDRKASIHGL